MENGAGFGPLSAESHVQGIGDELGAHVVGQRPAHYGAAGEVDDGGHSVELAPSRTRAFLAVPDFDDG
jgi:hypothetical protein